MSINKVIIYGKEDCVWCEKALALATEMHYDVTYKKLEDVNVRDEFIKIFPDVRTVPQIKLDGAHVGGYVEFEEILNGRNKTVY